MSYTKKTTDTTSLGGRFRIHKECIDWFKNLRKLGKYFNTDFDSYYFSFLIGSLANQKKSFITNESNDLGPYFISKYFNQKNIIIACLIRAEIINKGLDMDKRKHIEKQLIQILDSNTPADLSNNGYQLMNEFAYGGFIYLNENINTKPNTESAFFASYYNLLDQIKR